MQILKMYDNSSYEKVYVAYGQGKNKKGGKEIQLQQTKPVSCSSDLKS